MKFPNKMPVFSGRPLSHRSPADRLKQEGIPVRFSRFSEAQAGKQRDRQTDQRCNCEPMKDRCISTRCDGGFHWQRYDF
jgi:hypothetical protein